MIRSWSGKYAVDGHRCPEELPRRFKRRGDVRRMVRGGGQIKSVWKGASRRMQSEIGIIALKESIDQCQSHKSAFPGIESNARWVVVKAMESSKGVGRFLVGRVTKAR